MHVDDRSFAGFGYTFTPAPTLTATAAQYQQIMAANDAVKAAALAAAAKPAPAPAPAPTPVPQTAAQVYAQAQAVVAANVAAVQAKLPPEVQQLIGPGGGLPPSTQPAAPQPQAATGGIPWGLVTAGGGALLVAWKLRWLRFLL